MERLASTSQIRALIFIGIPLEEAKATTAREAFKMISMAKQIISAKRRAAAKEAAENAKDKTPDGSTSRGDWVGRLNKMAFDNIDRKQEERWQRRFGRPRSED